MTPIILINNKKYYLVTSITTDNVFNVVEIKHVVLKYFQHEEILNRLFMMIFVKIIFMILNIYVPMTSFMAYTGLLILWDGFKNYKNYSFFDITNNTKIKVRY